MESKSQPFGTQSPNSASPRPKISAERMNTNASHEKRNASIKKAAQMLLGCYRTGDAHDPEIYVTAAVAVLSDYPLDIVNAVTDPRTGIPSRIKWLPTIAEIKDACEDIAGPRRRMAEWETRSRAQLDERAQLEALDGNTERERITEGFKQLLARLQPDKADKANQYTPEAVKAKLGLTDEQWASMPDALPDSTWQKVTPPCP
jgi:hypothetical protein